MGSSHTVNSYFGAVFFGGPEAQEFSVVFDTGSGHVIVPSSSCPSPACLGHRQYDVMASTTGSRIDADGALVREGQGHDQVSIEFGTGEVTGEFAHEQVCLGPGRPALDSKGTPEVPGRCTRMHVVAAVAMSEEFEAFAFDGVFGLGLDALGLSPDFGFFPRYVAEGAAAEPQFAVFLADDARGAGEEQSELAIGGHNAARLATPLSWAPVLEPEQGYWQVAIRSVKVGNTSFSDCAQSSCRGIVDTGTSAIGVPQADYDDLKAALLGPSGALQAAAGSGPEASACRPSPFQPAMTLDVGGVVLTLGPEDYMPRAPLEGEPADVDAAEAEAKRCHPQLVPMGVHTSLGSKIFILGEPVLRRYYAVFDRRGPRVGFGEARHGPPPAPAKRPRGGLLAAARMAEGRRAAPQTALPPRAASQ